MLSLDDLAYTAIASGKAAFVAGAAVCSTQLLRGKGTCAGAPDTSAPGWPVYILASLLVLGSALWLNAAFSSAWENEKGVLRTPSLLRLRFGERVKVPAPGQKPGTPEWWADQVVVVTGGAGGLGCAIAHRVLNLGARVAVWDVKSPDVSVGSAYQETEVSSSSRFLFTQCNVAARDAVVSAAGQLHSKFGPATILVNNAGIHSGLGKTIEQLSGEEVNRIFGINVLSHFWTLHALLPDMLATGSGHVVSIASIMGQMPIAHLADYVATKHAIKGLHYSLRRELDSVHATPFVRTTYVALGRMQTPLFSKIKYDAWSEFVAPTVDPEDVASAIVRELGSGQSGAVRLPLHAKVLGALEFAPSWLIDLVYSVGRVDSAMD